MIVQAQTGEDDSRTGKDEAPGRQAAAGIEVVSRPAGKAAAQDRDVERIGDEATHRHHEKRRHSRTSAGAVGARSGEALNERTTSKASKAPRTPAVVTR